MRVGTAHQKPLYLRSIGLSLCRPFGQMTSQDGASDTSSVMRAKRRGCSKKKKNRERAAKRDGWRMTLTSRRLLARGMDYIHSSVVALSPTD